MIKALATHAPSVNPAMVLLTGASDIHSAFPEEVLPGVLRSYMIGLKAAFAVAVGFAGIAVLCSLLVPWRKLPTHENGDAPPMAMA